jgi:pantoate--beta-alanine ligase
MKIVTNSAELVSGCAFVPTMGALHEGHASLFKIAKELNQNVVASIFVNPLQFENKEDLAKYPRTPDRDIELAEASGVTHLWLPNQNEIYPSQPKVISAGQLGDIYEGAARKGHFDGVLTVVQRLFDLVKPAQAVFGEKDFQQLALVKTIAGDIEIIQAPIIREADGLAASSRNIRLDEISREKSVVISKALILASRADSLSDGRKILNEILDSEDALTLDYAEIIDEVDFSKAIESTEKKRGIVAGWINGVRLLDNMQMNFGGRQ